MLGLSLILTCIFNIYKRQSIKSNERSHRGTVPTLLLSCAKRRTPLDWKSFTSNDKNKTYLISLLLDQWTTDKYATRLVDRTISHVIGEDVFCLTNSDDNPLP